MKSYVYTVSSTEGEGWGKFLFDSTGAFTAITDFGNFANQFYLPEGKDVRQFLTEIGPNQMLSKIASQSEIDEARTLQEIETAISHQTDEEVKQLELKSLEQFKLELEHMPFLFAHFNWYQETSLDDEDAFLVKKYPNHAIRFSNETFVKLQEKLQKELLEKQ